MLGRFAASYQRPEFILYSTQTWVVTVNTRESGLVALGAWSKVSTYYSGRPVVA